MTGPKHFIWSQSGVAKLEDWFHGGGLAPELLVKCRGRIEKIGLFFGLMYVLMVPLVLFFPDFFPAAIQYRQLSWALLVVTILSTISSFVIWYLARRSIVSTNTLLNLAAGWEILLAFDIALARHVVPWEQSHHADWSEVAVWIILFSFVVPNTPRKTLIFSLLAALMDPLGLLAHIAAGNPIPSIMLWFQLFLPTFFSVAIVMVFSVTINMMSKDIHEARQMGSYQLLELIGKGGMGEVWLAEHRMLTRNAAIKVIPKENLEISDDESEIALRRFEQEARATASLDSDHTIQLYDFGTTDDGSFFYVMEFLDGMDLEEVVEKFGPLAAERVIYLLLQVCDSLEEAHHNGLIHRDIKPANIYLCRKGLKVDYVKVLDFGLVKHVVATPDSGPKLTVDGRITGTPAFLAPETILGDGHVDGRTDIYSLGCVAYWMLTGQLVFESTNTMKVVMDHISSEPPPLSSRTELPIPLELCDIVHDCLKKKPGERPQSAADLAARLAAIELGSGWTQQRAHHWWDVNLPNQHAQTGHSSSAVSAGPGGQGPHQASDQSS